MRRWALGGLAASLMLLGRVHAAENDVYQLPKPAKKANWWWPWGDSGKKEPEKKPAEKAKSLESKPTTEPARSVPTISPTDDPEFKAFLRRERACIRLQEIADETNDASLRIQAQEMIARAWELYLQRTGQPRGSGMSKAEEEAQIKKLLEETKAVTSPNAGPRISAKDDRTVERPVRSVNVPPLPGERGN